MVLAATFFASVLLVATATPVNRRAMTSLESLAHVPSGFVQSGAAPPTQELTLLIGLKQNNIPGLETAFYQVSDPDSPLYGQHLTREEVAQFVKPTDETFAAVSEWLSENSISSKPASPAGDMLELTIPVAEANKLFSTQFSVFKHTDTGDTSIRTLEYSIPTSLLDHVDFVHPTISFTPPLTPGAKFAAVHEMPAVAPDAAAVGDTCNSQTTPKCLQDMYGIPTTKATQTSNGLGVPGFLNEFASNADLELFLTKARSDMNPPPSFAFRSIDGGRNDESVPGVEANLDIQYTVGVATGVPVTFISVGRSDTTGFLDFANALLGDQSPPQVVSVSYGFNEADLSPAFTKSLCNAFMQLGARGTSVIVASGDGGVGGSRPSDTCTKFVPTFPASCPYVTSVGATTGTNEVGAGLSSGGFSEQFATPEYQRLAVDLYLLTHIGEYEGRFNRSGRGFPDVAAQGEHIVIAWKNQFALVDGTSASAPIFASIIALLNDQRITAGKPPLGFLNPLLYSRPDALNDIISGNNPSCQTNGFSAAFGWDPITGLGTPNFARLARVVGV